MNSQEEPNISSYSHYLPRVFQQKAGQSDEDYFLGRFLKAFEAVLSGKTDAAQGEAVGIEALLDSFTRYLDPAYTPAAFLPWLAGWVGLELEDGVEYYGEQDTLERGKEPDLQQLPLSEARSSTYRELIGRIVQLYKKRGTLDGLKEYLQVFAGEESTIAIEDYEEPIRLGTMMRAGMNTMVGTANPYYFSVHALIPAHSRTMLQKKTEILEEVIRKEKPYYTNAKLNVEVPQMRVGVYGRVGKETLLGGMAKE